MTLDIEHWIVFEGTRDAVLSAVRRGPEEAADHIMRLEHDRDALQDQLKGQ